MNAQHHGELPTFMYGTAWKKEATAKLVIQAVESGFLAIDTANQFIHYQEKLVGEAILALQQKGVTRESLYLQTKFTSVGGQGRSQEIPYDTKASITEQVKQSIDSSLEHLHTDYLDSYVLHGPYHRNTLADDDWEAWAAIEEQQASGKAKVIGISNVTAYQLAQLCSKAKVKPTYVQNRCYASQHWDKEVRDICSENNIVYQGFSLLTANPEVLSSIVVRTAATRLKVGVAQIVFRFAMHIGMLPLTGTTNIQHMKDDLQSVNIELTEEEINEIETVSLTRRG